MPNANANANANAENENTQNKKNQELKKKLEKTLLFLKNIKNGSNGITATTPFASYGKYIVEILKSDFKLDPTQKQQLEEDGYALYCVAKYYQTLKKNLIGSTINYLLRPFSTKKPKQSQNNDDLYSKYFNQAIEKENPLAIFDKIQQNYMGFEYPDIESCLNFDPTTSSLREKQAKFSFSQEPNCSKLRETTRLCQKLSDVIKTKNLQENLQENHHKWFKSNDWLEIRNAIQSAIILCNDSKDNNLFLVLSVICSVHNYIEDYLHKTTVLPAQSMTWLWAEFGALFQENQALYNTYNTVIDILTNYLQNEKLQDSVLQKTFNQSVNEFQNLLKSIKLTSPPSIKTELPSPPSIKQAPPPCEAEILKILTNKIKTTLKNPNNLLMIRLFAAFTAFPTHEGILELKGRLLKDKLLPHITEELIQKLKKYTPTDYIISKGPYYGLFELTSQNPTPAVIRYQQVIADMDAYLKALKAKDNTFNSLNTEDLNENNKTGEDSIENFLSKLGDNSF